MSKGTGVVTGIVAHPIKWTIAICVVAALLLVSPAYIVVTTAKVGDAAGVGLYATFRGVIAVPAGWNRAKAAAPAPAGP